MQQETDAEMPMESAMSRLHPATCIQLFFPTASPADLQLPRLDSLILLSDVTSASGRSKLPDFPVSYPSSCTPEGWLAEGSIFDPSALLDVSPTSPHLCNVFLMVESLFIFFIITMILIGGLTSQRNPGRRDSANGSERGMLRTDFSLALSMWSQIILRIPAGLISRICDAGKYPYVILYTQTPSFFT